MILCTKKVLVDSLADLPCLSYHFDNEIEEVSKHAFERREDLIANENDLHTVSIIFRVFRTYGDYVLSDIFNIFKGNSGKFKKSLVEDVKGMLSFYEAVHFGTMMHTFSR
ncbi:BnaC07g18170D, partial [Brassica napus]